MALFDPPFNPSFVFVVGDEYSTIRDLTDRGNRQTRARRSRKLRRWRLRWEGADQATLDYIRAWVEFHLGEALTFTWEIPCPDLFTNPPVFNAATLLAGDPGGALSDGTFDVVYSFNNAQGETQASPILQVTLSAGTATQIITVTAPPRFPADTDDIRVFANVTASTPQFQGVIANPSDTLVITTIAAGANPVSVNGMQGIPTVTASDTPRFSLVAKGVWAIEVDLLEVLS